MKKNKAMRLASALLVLTLLTTCAVSSTFAKYATSTSGSDKARVAYWGFGQNASTTLKLFSDSYTNVKAATGSVDGYDKVIAPGTDGSTTFEFAYTSYKSGQIKAPEVAYTLTVEPKIDGDFDSLDSNPSFKWTLKKGDGAATEYTTTTALLDAIKALSGSDTGTQTYDAGKLPTAFTDGTDNVTYTIGWKWDFAGTDNTTQDPIDTTMGNSQTLENVDISIAITATQND